MFNTQIKASSFLVEIKFIAFSKPFLLACVDLFFYWYDTLQNAGLESQVVPSRKVDIVSFIRKKNKTYITLLRSPHKYKKSREQFFRQHWFLLFFPSSLSAASLCLFFVYFLATNLFDRHASVQARLTNLFEFKSSF